MTLAQIKAKMLSWRDFYGADIMEDDRINAARTKKELAAILNDYQKYMEDRQIDAMSDLNHFRRKLGLNFLT